jgi:hypothetical protein
MSKANERKRGANERMRRENEGYEDQKKVCDAKMNEYKNQMKR